MLRCKYYTEWISKSVENVVICCYTMHLFPLVSSFGKRFTFIILSLIHSSILGHRIPAIQITHMTALAVAVGLIDIARGAAG
jgi:hypothetical protein